MSNAAEGDVLGDITPVVNGVVEVENEVEVENGVVEVETGACLPVSASCRLR